MSYGFVTAHRNNGCHHTNTHSHIYITVFNINIIITTTSLLTAILLDINPEASWVSPL